MTPAIPTPDAQTSPKKRGPNTPEGKARSRDERAAARPAGARFRTIARGGPGRVGRAPGRPAPRPRSCRPDRGEAGHRHCRRDVEGDPRRSDGSRRAHRDALRRRRRPRPGRKAPRPLPRHRDPLRQRRRHGDPARAARLPRPPQGQEGRPGPHRARHRARGLHERFVGHRAARACAAISHERIPASTATAGDRPAGRPARPHPPPARWHRARRTPTQHDLAAAIPAVDSPVLRPTMAQSTSPCSSGLWPPSAPMAPGSTP